jgi:hypothetical protein
MKLTESEMKELECKLPDFTRASLERVLATIPERGALSLEVTEDEITGCIERIDRGLDTHRMRIYNALRWFLLHRIPTRRSAPAPEPEPVSKQDDADTLEEVEKALSKPTEGEICYLWGRREEYNKSGALCDYQAIRPVVEMFVTMRRARLTAPQPPTKQERVTTILHARGIDYPTLAAEIVAELEAQNGKCSFAWKHPEEFEAGRDALRAAGEIDKVAGNG